MRIRGPPFSFLALVWIALVGLWEPSAIREHGLIGYGKIASACSVVGKDQRFAFWLMLSAQLLQALFNDMLLPVIQAQSLSFLFRSGVIVFMIHGIDC